ncbi:hypothetical protein GPECTOR_15g324 [Gonium pectorale]|uniref:TRP C-terminal domain-containing protein n=1 Tax=Gonium pectorale TaxID=33097 RepID=A0A150GMR6_GONPE|nr:hypothetical protein GPECTOR_15g324 [Gonium pectorale]|eukprot:KXZ50640.1 hypothetical protein GPECTOR_15g324 [Gonium pectorale]
MSYVDAGIGKDLSAPLVAGIASFQNLVMRGWPGTYVLTFSLSGGEGLGFKVKPYELEVELRRCSPGEELDRTVAKERHHSSWTACAACPPNKYGLWNDSRRSLDNVTNASSYMELMDVMWNSTEQQMAECRPCPRNAECPGGAIVVPEPGLAVLSLVVNAMLVLFTAVTNFADGFDDDGDVDKLAAAATAAAAPTAGAKAAGGDSLGARNVDAAKERKAKVELGDVVKVVVLHLQYVVIVTRLNVDYPSIITRCQAVFSTITGAENYIVYNPTCLWPNRDSAGQAEVQLLAGILTPCAVVALSLAVWTISMALSRIEPHLNRPIEKADQKLGLWDQLTVVFMAAVFILFPSWAHTAFSTFACYRIDDGSGAFPDAQRATWLYGYWVRDMQAKCYDGRHLSFYVPIGVASVCIFCLAPPLTSFFIVRGMGERRLKEDHVRKVYGFLYKRYKERFIWWETVLQLETLALVAVEVLGRALVALLLLATFLVIAAVNISCSPLLSRLLVVMEFLSLVTLGLTITLSLFFTVGESLDPVIEGTLAGLIIVMNAGVILFYLSVLARRFWPALTDLLSPSAVVKE